MGREAQEIGAQNEKHVMKICDQHKDLLEQFFKNKILNKFKAYGRIKYNGKSVNAKTDIHDGGFYKIQVKNYQGSSSKGTPTHVNSRKIYNFLSTCDPKLDNILNNYIFHTHNLLSSLCILSKNEISCCNPDKSKYRIDKLKKLSEEQISNALKYFKIKKTRRLFFECILLHENIKTRSDSHIPNILSSTDRNGNVKFSLYKHIINKLMDADNINISYKKGVSISFKFPDDNTPIFTLTREGGKTGKQNNLKSNLNSFYLMSLIEKKHVLHIKQNAVSASIPFFKKKV